MLLHTSSKLRKVVHQQIARLNMHRWRQTVCFDHFLSICFHLQSRRAISSRWAGLIYIRNPRVKAPVGGLIRVQFGAPLHLHLVSPVSTTPMQLPSNVYSFQMQSGHINTGWERPEGFTYVCMKERVYLVLPIN